MSIFNFLSPKIEAFGVDISDLSIKIADLENRKGIFKLTSYGRHRISSGIIDRGKIQDKDKFVQLMKEAVQNVQGAKLKKNYIVCSLPEQEAFIRMIQLPLLKKEEVREAVKWEMETHIPLKADEVYFDYFVIDPTENHLDHFDIVVGALPRNIVDDYVDVFRRSGLKIKAMEVESIATSRSLIRNGFSSRPRIIIDFGARRTSFTVFSGRAPLLTASSNISNHYLLDVLVKKLNISRQEAKKMKFKYGLNDSKIKRKVSKAFADPLAELVSDIKKYLNFYERYNIHKHGAGEEIQEIFLCGGGANLDGLPLFLSRELGISVKIADPWINITKKPRKYIPPISLKQSLEYTTVLGLALYGAR